MPRKSKSQIDMEQSGLIAQPDATQIQFPKAIETDEEREIFRHLIESNPSAHLYSGAVENLTVQLVRHQIMADKLAKAIRDCDEPRMLVSLAKSQKDESVAMAMIAVKLKMTPQSISNFRGNLLPKEKTPKPWEWNG